MFDISFPVAFVGGFASFFAPCVVPLLPTYIAYITGVSISGLSQKGVSGYRGKILSSALLYILGFSLVFVLLGVAASGVGSALRQYQMLIQKVGGIIIIAFGLQTGGFWHFEFLSRGGLKIPVWINNLGTLRSFFIGVIFALVWTPCVGVILGSILTLAAAGAHMINGALLLFVYSLGISFPFLIVALTLGQAPHYIGWFTKHVLIISRVVGILLILLGILLITDTYKYVNGWIFSLAFRLGYEVR